MQSIKLAVELSRETACRLGLASCGLGEYTLTDENMSSLSEEERAEVAAIAFCDILTADRTPNAHRLQLQGPPKWEYVVNALRERIAARKTEAAKQTEYEETAIIQALERPVDEWVERAYNTYRPSCPRSVPFNRQNDPRVQARLAEAESLAKQQQQTLDETLAKEEAEKTAEKQQVEAAKAAATIALTEMAKSEPSLSRAAVEEYPVANAMLKLLAKQCYDHINSQTGIHTSLDNDTYVQPPDARVRLRNAPSPENFELYDIVKAIAANRNIGIDSAIGQWSVSPILSIDTCPHKGSEHRITAVLCTLKTPIEDWEITVSLEEIPCRCGECEEAYEE